MFRSPVQPGFEDTGENWHTLIRRAWCGSLQTCRDRLHMPGNLEFIRPPFLISAPVIQINSNEISRGKAAFGWGVYSSPQLSPIQWPFPLAKAKSPPLPTSTCGRMNLRCCHSDTESVRKKRASTLLLAWGDSLWIYDSILKPILVHSTGTWPNRHGEIRWRLSLTNGRTAGGILFYAQCVCGGL